MWYLCVYVCLVTVVMCGLVCRVVPNGSQRLIIINSICIYVWCGMSAWRAMAEKTVLVLVVVCMREFVFLVMSCYMCTMLCMYVCVVSVAYVWMLTSPSTSIRMCRHRHLKS